MSLFRIITLKLVCVGNGLYRFHCDTSILFVWGTYNGITNNESWHYFTLLVNGISYFYTLVSVLVFIYIWFLSTFTSKEFLAFIWYYSLFFGHIDIVLSVQGLWVPPGSRSARDDRLRPATRGPYHGTLKFTPHLILERWNLYKSGVGLLPFSHHYAYILRNHFHHVLQSPSDLA